MKRPIEKSVRLEDAWRLVRPLQVVIDETIRSAVGLCGGNLDLAAERLGIGRAVLDQKLREALKRR